jgi:hypothetical protein
MIDIETTQFEKRLKGVERPSLKCERKEEIKKSIFHQIEAFSVAKFSLDRVSRARIKEKIFDVLDSGFGKLGFFGNLFAYQKKFISLAVLFVFGIGIFSFYPSSQNFVIAAPLSVLKSFGGEVIVNRDGEFIDVYEGMSLVEGDTIYTSEDGLAVIEYFENSVSRLSGNTELVLNKFEIVENDFESFGIEVVVVRGVVWSKVLSTDANYSGFFLNAKDIKTFSKRGTFNVRVDEDELEIGVFHNSLDLVDDDQLKTIRSGNRLVVNDFGQRTKEVKEMAETQDDWVAQNLEDDRKYLSEVENRLLLARAKSVGINIGDEISFRTSLKENALLFFTFDDVKKKKLELDIAERNFIAAQIKLMNPNLSQSEIDEINTVISSFSDKVKDFYKFAEQVAYTDPDYSERLKNYVGEKVTVNKKDLAVVMPDSPVYVALSVVEELELLRAKDVLEETSLKLAQVVEKIVSIDSIFYEEEEFWTSARVNQYMNSITKAMALVHDFDRENGDLDPTRGVLLAKIYEDLDVLENMGVISRIEVDKFKGGVDKIVVGRDYVNDYVGVAVIAVVEEEEVVEEEVYLDRDKFIKGPYGVGVYEDKPLSPFLDVSLD